MTRHDPIVREHWRVKCVGHKEAWVWWSERKATVPRVVSRSLVMEVVATRGYEVESIV